MWFIALYLPSVTFGCHTSDCGKFVYYVTMAINMIGIVLGIMMVFRPFMAFVSASFYYWNLFNPAWNRQMSLRLLVKIGLGN